MKIPVNLAPRHHRAVDSNSPRVDPQRVLDSFACSWGERRQGQAGQASGGRQPAPAQPAPEPASAAAAEPAPQGQEAPAEAGPPPSPPPPYPHPTDLPTVPLSLAELPENVRRAVVSMQSSHAARRRVLLLEGPPGTGKSSIAHNIPAMLGALFFHPDRELLSHQFSGSHNRIITYFEKVQAYAQALGTLAVIVVDDVEGFVRNRQESVEDRERELVTNAFLAAMDTLRASDSRMIFVGTTNNVNQIDPAMRDRLGAPVSVPLPAADRMQPALAAMLAARALPAPTAAELEELAELCTGVSFRKLTDWLDEAPAAADFAQLKSAFLAARAEAARGANGPVRILAAPDGEVAHVHIDGFGAAYRGNSAYFAFAMRERSWALRIHSGDQDCLSGVSLRITDGQPLAHDEPVWLEMFDGARIGSPQRAVAALWPTPPRGQAHTWYAPWAQMMRSPVAHQGARPTSISPGCEAFHELFLADFVRFRLAVSGAPTGAGGVAERPADDREAPSATLGTVGQMALTPRVDGEGWAGRLQAAGLHFEVQRQGGAIEVAGPPGRDGRSYEIALRFGDARRDTFWGVLMPDDGQVRLGNVAALSPSLRLSLDLWPETLPRRPGAARFFVRARRWSPTTPGPAALTLAAPPVRGAGPRVRFADPDDHAVRPRALHAGGRLDTSRDPSWRQSIRMTLNGWAYCLWFGEMDEPARERASRAVVRCFGRSLCGAQQGPLAGDARAFVLELRAQHRWMSGARARAVADALVSAQRGIGPPSADTQERFGRVVRHAIWPADEVEAPIVLGDFPAAAAHRAHAARGGEALLAWLAANLGPLQQVANDPESISLRVRQHLATNPSLGVWCAERAAEVVTALVRSGRTPEWAARQMESFSPLPGAMPAPDAAPAEA